MLFDLYSEMGDRRQCPDSLENHPSLTIIPLSGLLFRIGQWSMELYHPLVGSKLCACSLYSQHAGFRFQTHEAVPADAADSIDADPHGRCRRGTRVPEIGMVFPQYDSFVINLIISLPSLAIVLAGLVIGALADRLGKVRVLLVSLALFGVAGVSGYFINDIPTLLVGRFFVGVGIAGISCRCTALVAE